MWVILALVAAIASATQDVFGKKLLVQGTSLYILGGFQYFLGGILLLSISFSQGFPRVTLVFVVAVATTVMLNVAAQMLQFRALKHGDISLVSPMLAFSPIFLVFTSYIILGEKPSAFGFLGIMVIVTGSYILNGGMNKSPRSILRAVKENPAGISMLIVTFILSISSNFDKIAITQTSALFAAAVVDSILGLIFFTLAFSLGNRRFPSGLATVNILLIVGVGLITSIAVWASNAALALQIVPYVISVKRLSVVFAVLFGMLIFKERNIPERFFGAVVMLLGVILIAL